MPHRRWLWINRAISSSLLTPLIAKTSLTPNQITILSMSSGILSGIFLSLGSYEAGLWGVLFYELACLLDNVDGEIARLKNLKSEFGAKLDITCDMVTDTALFIGLLIGATKVGIPGPLPFLFWISIFGLAAHYTLMFIKKSKGGKARTEGKNRNSIISEILNAANEGEISIVVVVLGLLGLVYWTAWLIPIYINALWILRVPDTF
ncbi:MAG: CDP-alcohol phosphatidyltransferase family protein [Candidatus Omnitrophica bacterium]|nr:CDP-alcohol phosphatidyltransferase family protein [Candidatus Omnitrophota bacterium]